MSKKRTTQANKPATDQDGFYVYRHGKLPAEQVYRLFQSGDQRSYQVETGAPQFDGDEIINAHDPVADPGNDVAGTYADLVTEVIAENCMAYEDDPDLEYPQIIGSLFAMINRAVPLMQVTPADKARYLREIASRAYALIQLLDEEVMAEIQKHHAWRFAEELGIGIKIEDFPAKVISNLRLIRDNAASMARHNDPGGRRTPRQDRWLAARIVDTLIDDGLIKPPDQCSGHQQLFDAICKIMQIETNVKIKYHQLSDR